MKILISLILLSVLSFVSCVESSKTPEGTLENFVLKRFDGASIDDVKDYMSDEFAKGIREAKITTVEDGQETVKDFDVLKNLKKKKFKIISKNCSAEECKITYFVSYVTVDGNQKEFETETKKVATLIPSADSGWVINKIDHVKTYHDMVKDLEVPTPGEVQDPSN